MAKLSLVIADPDRPYLESLADYILACYPQQFKVSSFGDAAGLSAYLAQESGSTDILLASPDLQVENPAADSACVVILLADSRNPQRENAVQNAVVGNVVDKYQTGDRLVESIMNAYARLRPESSFRENADAGRLIAVYSPAGGAGKTAVAVGASMQSVLEGKEVFYLNLESFASTPLYFDCSGNAALPDILFGADGGAVCRDPVYKVHYFLPPVSSLDYHERTQQQVRSLLRRLASSGRYDRIFIDMSSELNPNNLAVLEECDDILLLCTPAQSSALKADALLKEFAALEHRRKNGLTEKVRMILNKYEAREDGPETSEPGSAAMLKIPLVDRLMIRNGNKLRPDMNSSFGAAIHRLLNGLSAGSNL